MEPRSSHDSSSTLAPSSDFPSLPESVTHWHLLSPHGVVTTDILNSKYDGSGTESDPYIISFLKNDPGDPKQLPAWRKWIIVATVSIVTFIAALGSSIYLGILQQTEEQFRVSEEVAILGLSLFILGFVAGPLFFAPCGELAGRQVTLIGSFVGYTVFNAATIASQNIQTLLVLRFLAGFFAACSFTNSTGTLADIFEPAQRGMAFGFYAATPFMGPILGPAIGGFLGTAAGWRWVLGLLTILSGLGLVLSALLVPETYGAELLNRRAKKMSKLTGKHYVSRLSVGKEPTSVLATFKKDLSRPWAILFLDPIVLCLSTWVSIVYGTLYLFLAGYPFVYQEARGWSPGIGGLALLGIGGGVLVASAVNIPVSKQFGAKAKKDSAPPEVRLQPAMVGGLFIPMGIFWFAWTNAPSIPWPSSVIAGSFFGFGMVIVWTSVNNYLTDAYKIYAASALAGQVVMRSIFGAVFPLFTGYMFRRIGLHWAASVPGFIALACAPLPFIFYRFGRQIRARSKYASKADADTAALHEQKGSA
ncbi:hypothetical protein H2198_000631 [Neophaeococcomyces mojaviensis]|uniref:Uncharacterized protein n=1 Tax=Neophaeococcomyces mojaviensis TaxID=3383035 RepID=A0ACC3AJD4_9EURO|nr:hypothetical protein H2198_000631 [Knufia sp. JES_112]